MEKLLIKYSGNWADEMDLEGLFIVTKDEWEAYKKIADGYFNLQETLSYHVGTNEEIEYQTYSDLMEDFEVLCDDIYSCGLGGLDGVNFIPCGFCGPAKEDFEIDDEE